MEPESIAVFVPKEWRETKDISLLELQLKSDMSATHKCYDRPLNPMIFEATIEFMERMCTCMYENSDNPIIVPLVVARKATAPLYVCVETMCGPTSSLSPDVNSFRIFNMIRREHGVMFFHEMDLTNALHQVPLPEHTSHTLSMMTP